MKYERIRANEVRFEQRHADNCDLLLVAYGTSARIAKGALAKARLLGIRAGMFRPITLWPFPYEELKAAASGASAVLVVELSAGQLIEDVRLATSDRVPVLLEGRMGGGIPSVSDVLERVKSVAAGSAAEIRG
jgi:2-oxoglutarate ferredoxin oxidoreductase subunit alpha